MLTVGLEGVDETRLTDAPSQQRGIRSPACADVKCDASGRRELLCYARGEIAFESLSPEVEPRAEPRRDESGEADGSTERVDSRMVDRARNPIGG